MTDRKQYEAVLRPPPKPKLNLLSKFVKNECASFVEGRCVFQGECNVLKSESCKYFEVSVLGPEDYKFR